MRTPTEAERALLTQIAYYYDPAEYYPGDLPWDWEDKYGSFIDAIKDEAVEAHEAVLRKRGWMDECEAETATAMSYGEGMIDARRSVLSYLRTVLAGLGE